MHWPLQLLRYLHKQFVTAETHGQTRHFHSTECFAKRVQTSGYYHLSNFE